MLNEANKYQLQVFNYSGTAYDGLAGIPQVNWIANGSKFTTYDSMNSANSGGGVCPVNNKGGWWYKLCGGAVLNGDGMNGWAFFAINFGAASRCDGRKSDDDPIDLIQGGTKASHKRGQITLGVFPNCHENQKIDYPVLKIFSAVY